MLINYAERTSFFIWFELRVSITFVSMLLKRQPKSLDLYLILLSLIIDYKIIADDLDFLKGVLKFHFQAYVNTFSSQNYNRKNENFELLTTAIRKS